ncbi:MAG: hypothetical protein M3347_14595, partial [Armatimonadota bacterium]|nr:hypothetical protein [Armatimonadota bacterium]
IQPDEFYPVYGDASIKGFEAQSTSALYVRVDKERSYVLYGDFTTNGDYSTQGFSSGRNLGDYIRSLTGFKGHHETGNFSTNFFLSHDNARQVIDEIRATGTSGPYQLRATPFIENSEKVEIIVRDREQPSVILETIPQARFTDYQIDGLTEGILFRRPIPSFDANLNPIFIRVTYEIEQGGPKFFVMGADGQYKLTDRFAIGTTWARDRNPQDPFTLLSLNANYRLGSNTWLIGEWARTDRLSIGRGDAQRLELLHESRRLLARAFWGQSDAGFDNPSSILSRGREEANARISYLLNGQTRLTSELIRTSDATLGGTRVGAQLSLERQLGENLRLDLGVRYAHESSITALPGGAAREPIDFTSIRARLSGQVPNHPQAGGYVEYEQDIKDSSKRCWRWEPNISSRTAAVFMPAMN